jgi:hypothetical protein
MYVFLSYIYIYLINYCCIIVYMYIYMNVILNFFYQFFEMKAYLETVSEHLNLVALLE